MARFRYEELSPVQFEALVVDICCVLIGPATRGFATGPDGGRDARFNGTANDFPSRRDPWMGSTIIQAKHAMRSNASFSDTDFMGKGKTLDTEIVRIKNLVDSDELDHYALFSNRKLTGAADASIANRISKECGLKNSDIYVGGIESIDRLLTEHGSIADRHHLELLSAPLRVTRDGLAEVIEAMQMAIGEGGGVSEDKPVSRVSLKRKNELNEVADDEIEPFRRRYLKDTQTIGNFLANPMNGALLEKYNDAIDELNVRLPHLIKLHGGFMGAWHAIYDIMIGHDETLRRNARLVRAVQFYMYWNCDFGRREADALPE